MTAIATYRPAADELDLVLQAHQARLPVMLTGPTGCGKTRLVETIATRLGRPLVTVTCHDDLTTADLLGRYLVSGGDVVWVDGPLTRAVRDGAVCYLDEVIEARHDTLAALHSLADHRRTLFLERSGETITAPESFMLICSYNPRRRGAFKELGVALRQRFVTVTLDYLDADHEAQVVAEESGVDPDTASRLVAFARLVRTMDETGLMETPSTRSLVAAARMVVAGAPERRALELAVLAPLQLGPAQLAAVWELCRATAG
jgi:MoxR-like ATPase